jgi:hypothetical protein
MILTEASGRCLLSILYLITHVHMGVGPSTGHNETKLSVRFAVLTVCFWAHHTRGLAGKLGRHHCIVAALRTKTGRECYASSMGNFE